MKKIILLFVLLTSIVFSIAEAADAFVVKKIDIQGLQRVSAETVYSYLPIRTGQTLRPDQTSAVIKALYNTGFFDHITLARSGNTLIITLVERPTIGQLKISGNSAIPKDKLTTVMTSVNVAEGRVFDRAMLEKIQQSLLNQYYELGRYNARVDTTVTPMERNRVLVKIDISEGLVAKVRRINIIGNHAFTEKELDKQLTLTTPGILTFFTQTDRYSQEKLDSSVENLRNYYLDHGYVKFAVKSSQVAITPDRKSIYLTIVIDEGAVYRIKDVNLKGDLILPREDAMALLKIHPGDIFSRKQVMDSEKALNDALGNKGYVFAVISLDPKIDDIHKEISLTFVVKPGKRVYVRQIYFSDNTKTNDETFRREMVQMEAAPVSLSQLEQSKHRLSLEPYVKDVQMSIIPVENSNDQVDINYKVKEDSAATANFSIGYSQLDHFLIGAGLNQKNFLGTGNTLGLNASTSRFQDFFGINYMNPYFTPDGIGRSLSFSVSKFNPEYANSSRSYSTNQLNASDVYSFPLGQEKDAFNRLQLGYGYEDTIVQLANSNISQQVNDFSTEHGTHFQQVDLITGFSRDSRDRSIFPTRGMLHTLNANMYFPIVSGSLKYYTFAYNLKSYYPLTENFIFIGKAGFQYGSSFDGDAANYPFFKNFYAGGIGTVRGYEGNTLGPRDSNGYSTGGNMAGTGSLAMTFPNHISDNLRTSIFFDGGYVFDTFNNRDFVGTASGSFRYSTGVEADWLTPMGLIDVSYAKPLNRQPGDNSETFQFSLGANFG
jgi:outer membrane protein insertion porin family